MRKLLSVVLLTFLSAGLLSSQATKTESWSWLSTTFTPCEGVGAFGNARYFVEVRYLPSPYIDQIAEISLYGQSAAFDDETIITATVEAPPVMPPQWGKGIKATLQRPRTSVVEASPAPNTTRRIYFIPRDGFPCTGVSATCFGFASIRKIPLRISVVAIKDNCHINSSADIHLLP
jgi:hypothetical protein